MDFSLHEQRRLAQIEEELPADRRLVALMELLGSHRTRAWRQMQYTTCRLRRPRRGTGRTRPASLPAELAPVMSLGLTAAVPVVLIVALVLGLGALAVLTVCVLPLTSLLLVASYRWARGSG